MKKAIISALIAFSLQAGGQAVRWEYQATTLNNSAVLPGGEVPVLALPSATVQILNSNLTPATTYTDSTEAHTCTAGFPLTRSGSGACYSFADQQGKFGAWLAPGTYAYNIVTTSGASYGPYYFTAATTSGLPSGVSGDGANGLNVTGKVAASSFSASGTASGYNTMSGSISGAASISVPPSAGTPSTILLPTTDPASGQILTASTAASCTGYPTPNCVQLFWTSLGNLLVTDNFPGSALSANWTVVLGSFTVSGGYITPNTTGTNLIYWNAATFTRTQCSTVTIGTPGAQGAGPTVLTTSSGAYVSGASTANTSAITKYTVSGNSYVNLATGTQVWSSGDVMKLCSNGVGGLTLYRNGVSILTASDNTWTTGSPGILGYNFAGYTTLGAWVGSVF